MAPDTLPCSIRTNTSTINSFHSPSPGFLSFFLASLLVISWRQVFGLQSNLAMISTSQSSCSCHTLISVLLRAAACCHYSALAVTLLQTFRLQTSYQGSMATSSCSCSSSLHMQSDQAHHYSQIHSFSSFCLFTFTAFYIWWSPKNFIFHLICSQEYILIWVFSDWMQWIKQNSMYCTSTDKLTDVLSSALDK